MYILPPEWRGEVFLSCCVFGGFEGEDVHGGGCVGRTKVTWNFLPLLSKIKNIYKNLNPFLSFESFTRLLEKYSLLGVRG